MICRHKRGKQTKDRHFLKANSKCLLAYLYKGCRKNAQTCAVVPASQNVTQIPKLQIPEI